MPVLLSGVLLMGLGTIAAVMGFPAPAPAPQPQPDPDLAPLTSGEFRVLLHRASLDPDSLLSIGISGEQFALLVSQARTHLSQETLATIRSSDRAFASARKTHDDLYRKVQGRTATEQEVAAFPGARTAFASTKQSREQAIAGLRTAATTNVLTGGQIQLLSLSMSHSSWDVPQQYRMAVRTEPEWVALKRALAAVRIAQRNGAPVPAASQQIVSAANSDQNVANAAGWITTFGDAFRASFEQSTLIQP